MCAGVSELSLFNLCIFPQRKSVHPVIVHPSFVGLYALILTVLHCTALPCLASLCLERCLSPRLESYPCFCIELIFPRLGTQMIKRERMQ